jgi:hypothetical protein
VFTHVFRCPDVAAPALLAEAPCLVRDGWPLCDVFTMPEEGAGGGSHRTLRPGYRFSWCGRAVRGRTSVAGALLTVSGGCGLVVEGAWKRGSGRWWSGEIAVRAERGWLTVRCVVRGGDDLLAAVAEWLRVGMGTLSEEDGCGSGRYEWLSSRNGIGAEPRIDLCGDLFALQENEFDCR